SACRGSRARRDRKTSPVQGLPSEVVSIKDARLVFRRSWREACANAGLPGLTFHDLRGTAVTRPTRAGGTGVGIAYYTGAFTNRLTKTKAHLVRGRPF